MTQKGGATSGEREVAKGNRNYYCTLQKVPKKKSKPQKEQGSGAQRRTDLAFKRRRLGRRGRKLDALAWCRLGT